MNRSIVLCVDFRILYIERTLKEIHASASAGDFPNIQRHFESQRTRCLLDINAADPMTGNTLLHWAAEHNNSEWVDWCLKERMDPMLRDLRGRLASDQCRSEKVKACLKKGAS